MIREPTSLRRATLDDCADLAEIHAQAWTLAYQGVLQGVELRRLIARRTDAWWQGALRRGVEIMVLDVLGKPAGYATFGSCRLSDFPQAGEIYELYMRPDHQGLGFGRSLFAAVRKDLAARGRPTLAVQVLGQNSAARGFYQAIGGTLAATSTYRSAGQTLDLAIYTWPPLSTRA